MKARPLAYVLILNLAYSPILGSINGTIAAAQVVQNTTSTFQYDALGKVTQVTDPLNNVTTLSYDQLARLKQQVQPVPATGVARPTVNLGYDGLDQLNTFSDPRNLTTTYSNDGLSNQVSLASPDTGGTTRTYDSEGNVLTSTDARGKVTTYTYDVLGRVTNIAFTSGTPIVLEYDGGSSGAPNAIGHLTKMTDESGQTVYGYDQMGRVITKTQTTVSATGTIGRSVSYAYGNNGKLLSLTYPSGNRIVYGYNAAGRISSLTLNPADAAGGTDIGTATVLLEQISYAPFGAAQSWVWGNNTATVPNTYNRTFDLDGRVSTYPLGNIAAGTGMLRTVGYDAASRITSMTHTGTANASLYDQAMAYDGLGRLTNFTAGTTTQVYVYDASGNRTQLRLGASSYSNTISATSNRLNSTTGPYPAKNYQYDAAGNPSTDGTVSFSYSDRGRMKSSVNAGATTTYLYNGLDQRVSKAGSLVATGGIEYVYDENGRLLGEYNATGGIIQETVYLDNTPVSVLKQATTGSPAVATTVLYYVYSDHIATPRIITSAATGDIVWDWANSDPYGANSPNENPAGAGTFGYNVRFPGQYYDKETNLLYNGFRDYDPQTGRYVESDPIGLRGGLNTYGYVFGNPLSHIDPKGLVPPGFGPSSNIPGLDFIKALFPDSRKAPIPVFPDDVPGTGDACVQKYLDSHYPGWLVWTANFGNMQQYTQEDPAGGLHIAEEKLIITQGPGAVGARLVTAVPGSLAIGNRIGAGLIAASTGLSGVAELAGAFLTPFGTTAMAIAREACTCHQK
jgi:RHS repeat-associated protein